MLVKLHCNVVSSLLGPTVVFKLVAPTDGLTTVSGDLIRVNPGVDRARSGTGLFSCQCCVASSLLDKTLDCRSRLSSVELN